MPEQTDRKQVSVRIPLRLKAELEREADDSGISRSEYIRSILRDRHEPDRLRDRLATREERIDELEEQLARRSQIKEKIDTLARRADDGPDEPEPPFPVRWYRWFRSRRRAAD